MIDDYPLGVELNYLPVVHFAIQQNNISFIRGLAVQNNTGHSLRNIRITFSASPAFLLTEPYQIELIAPGEKLRIEKIPLELQPQYLLNNSKSQFALFYMSVTSDGENLFEEPYPVNILPYNQWMGGNILPEMMASFVTPGRAVLQPIIQKASVLLKEWTGNGSFDEYQSRDTDRVKKQMAAIFAVLSDQDTEIEPLPPRFLEKGFPVRMADDILSQSRANSLELALLYASCLEAAGLYPLIVLSPETILCGSWLTGETFPDSIIDDVVSLRKRIDYGIDEIAFVDASCISQYENPGFEKAVEQAYLQLKDENTFYYALDIHPARLSGIKPLPQRVLKGEEWFVDENEPTYKLRQVRKLYDLLPADLPDEPQDIVLTKQVIWERKLLDLSLRNSLLNLRITKSTLRLVSVDTACFEDALADGEEFRIFSQPDVPHKDRHLAEVLQSELASHRLRCYLQEDELKNTLLHLYRSSRLSIEENGANTLYLALGFLKWYETNISIKSRYAPILLLPVEIIRKPSTGGFVIRSREEETLLNITLLEMLRQNFGITIPGLDPLPVDDSGVNVKQIYSIIRNSIREKKNWSVEEEAILGIFSFNKFIMWNDIHNNAEKLKRNELVFSLMNGILDWDLQDMEADAVVLDRQLTPADILLPIGADSSQLEAIYEAVQGKTFILHGPPGTGKSQTITNIIANALYRGKRVLFVAEKMAALSVVQSRLAALGLDPFCLELHSNKTKKSLIMEQLKRSTEVVRYKSPQEFATEADRLNKLRGELNTYIDALHTTYPFGLSLYEAITLYLSDEEGREIAFPVELLPQSTPRQYAGWEEAVAELADVGKTFGHPHGHPLTGIRISTYSSAIKGEAATLLDETSNVIRTIREKIDNFNILIEKEGTLTSKKQLDTIFAIIGVLMRIPELTPSLLLQPSLEILLDEFREVSAQGKERDWIQQQITNSFTFDILNLPATTPLQEWKRSETKWFLPRYFAQRKIKQELKDYLIQGEVSNRKVTEILLLIISFQEKEKYVDEYSAAVADCFGKYGRRNKENWAVIDRIIAGTDELNSLILSYSADLQEAVAVKEVLSRNLFEGINTFRQMYGDFLRELYNLHEQLEDCNKRLAQLLNIELAILYHEGPTWIDDTLNRLAVWKENLHRLKEWCQWLRVEERLNSRQIGFIAQVYVKENIPTGEMVRIFRRSYRKAAIQYIFSQQPGLELFNGALFETVIDRYRNLTAQFEKISRRELYARLASSLPSFTKEASQNSEVGILQKNIRNKARGMSVRRLFELIPILLHKLCPCMLMSPISVAQYIDPEADPFDLVIFDEASQMPTYEAVGAMARGKHVVIVGDPKQMPPTSFFSVNTVDEENIEMEDLESILDDCLAHSVPSKHLLWHYRSRHESLIAFSNTEYYGNNLLTFPSPDNQESKVRLIPVTGYYDKGKSRQNRQEADAVIQEIVRRLSDEKLSEKSIGVVTFSSVQQALIEDRLSAVFESRPDLESIALERKEPLFIKNLENVQGDERDIILFSIGYGPDAAGKVSMNFGPLNRNGGERRLNVAVSRARYEMLIFSTLNSEMIDLNRTSAVGVAGLKRFLEYAERGTRLQVGTGQEEPENTTIGGLIAEQLRRLGYKVHTGIGSSGYKIDAAIVDEANPASYLLGIVCDGENYRNTKTARDREIVQNGVLAGLGWNICRVWTLDWYENRDAVIERLTGIIDKAKAQAGIPQTEETEQVVDEPLFEPEEGEVIEDAHPYNPATIKVKKSQAVDFFAAANRNQISSHIQQIIEQESPVSRSLIYKKIIKAWKIARQTQRFETYIDEILAQHSYYVSTNENIDYIWKEEEQYRTYEIYRPAAGREPADLPPEEIANGVRAILREQISIPMPDLIRVTGQLFGFPRSGQNIDAAMLRGIQEAIRRNYIKMNNGRIVVN